MANLKISQLPSVVSATTNDLLVVVNNGVTKKMTINDVVDLVPISSFTGNTSGDCISDIYVSNIHPCSPLNISGDTNIGGSLNISTIGGGTPLINLGLDSMGYVVTGTTGSSPSYTIFTAVVTDFGSVGDPQMTILENTLGVTPTITYVGTGEFRIEAVGEFPLGYTTAVFGNLQGNAFVNKQGVPSNDYVNWVTTANGGGAIDGQMYNMTVEIKVFTP